MRLVVWHGKGRLSIEEFDPDSLMELVETLKRNDDTLLAFALPDGMAYIPQRAVTRVDVFDT